MDYDVIDFLGHAGHTFILVSRQMFVWFFVASCTLKTILKHCENLFRHVGIQWVVLFCCCIKTEFYLKFTLIQFLFLFQSKLMASVEGIQGTIKSFGIKIRYFRDSIPTLILQNTFNFNNFSTTLNKKFLFPNLLRVLFAVSLHFETKTCGKPRN